MQSPVYSDGEWPAQHWQSPYMQQFNGERDCWSQHQSYSPQTEFDYRGQFQPSTDMLRPSRRLHYADSHEQRNVYDDLGAIPCYPDAVNMGYEHLSRSVSPDETEHSESSSVGWTHANLTPKPRALSSPELSIAREMSASDVSYMYNFGNSLLSQSDQGGMFSYPQGHSFVSPINVSGPIGIIHTVDDFAGSDEFERQGISIPFSSEGSYGGVKPFHVDLHAHMAIDTTSHFEDEHGSLLTPPVSRPVSPIEEDEDEDAEWSPKGTRTSKRNAQAAKSGPNNVLRPTRVGRVSKNSSPRTNGSHSGRNFRTSQALAPSGTISDERLESGSSNDGDKPKPFTCPLKPYGCRSRCASKNEWKRHITSQHFCLGYYRCDICADVDTRPNDFNRKDLFTQHLRRMHHSNTALPFDQHGRDGAATTEQANKDSQAAKGKKTNTSAKATAARKGGDDDTQKDPTLEQSIPHIQTRCFRQQREPPSSFRCAFCRKAFEGKDCYDAWLEHVAKHMAGDPGAKRLRRSDEAVDDAADSPACVGTSETVDWSVDEELRAWLLRENLLKQHGQSFTLADKGAPKA